MAKKKKRYSVRFARKPTPQMRAREKRAREAAIRLIAREDKISLKEARRIYKEQGLVEFLYTRPKRYTQRKFVKIAPDSFREIPPGKQIKEENATGPVRDTRYILRVQRMKEYWNFVDILKQEYRISTKEARERISNAKEKGVRFRALAGFISGEYPISQAMLRKMFEEN